MEDTFLAMSKSIIEQKLEERSKDLSSKIWNAIAEDSSEKEKYATLNLELKRDWILYFEETIEGFREQEMEDKELYLTYHLLSLIFGGNNSED